MEFPSKSATEKWAKDFAKGLKRPCVVLLDGELGAGKTQMVRWFAEALGSTPASSPTFAIHQTYESPTGNIEHVDLYRLENSADLESTGFWDLLGSKDLLMFVEWAGRLPPSLWPKGMSIHRVQISKSDDTEARSVKIS